MKIFSIKKLMLLMMLVGQYQLMADIEESTEIVLQEIDISRASYYEGYLIYNDHFKEHEFPFDFEKLLEGMKDAYKQRETAGFKEEEFRASIKRFQEYHLDQANKKRLIEANHFLEEISLRPEFVEIEKGKLYYKTLKQGKKSQILDDKASIVILYQARVLKDHLEEIYFEIEEPKEIILESTLPGFSRGLIGMYEGERRLLYIHPDLAYGAISRKVEPNTLMIFEVELLKIK